MWCKDWHATEEKNWLVVTDGIRLEYLLLPMRFCWACAVFASWAAVDLFDSTEFVLFSPWPTIPFVSFFRPLGGVRFIFK